MRRSIFFKGPCGHASHAYALCSTRTISRNSGYIQYHASCRGKMESVHPADRRPLLGRLVYTSSANATRPCSPRELVIRARLSIRSGGIVFQVVRHRQERPLAIVGFGGHAAGRKPLALWARPATGFVVSCGDSFVPCACIYASGCCVELDTRASDATTFLGTQTPTDTSGPARSSPLVP